jgi:hypothetical protein
MRTLSSTTVLIDSSRHRHRCSPRYALVDQNGIDVTLCDIGPCNIPMAVSLMGTLIFVTQCAGGSVCIIKLGFPAQVLMTLPSRFLDA